MISKKVILILCISFCFFASCSNKREIEITGYGHLNDRVAVMEDNKEIFNFKITAHNIDQNKMCAFYEKGLKIRPSTVKLNFKIDSSDIVVLDTTLVIPKEFKSPFVAFSYPSVKSKFKRVILLADNSMFPKE